MKRSAIAKATLAIGIAVGGVLGVAAPASAVTSTVYNDVIWYTTANAAGTGATNFCASKNATRVGYSTRSTVWQSSANGFKHTYNWIECMPKPGGGGGGGSW